MPLLLTLHPAPGATFGLWQITESEAFFRDDLPLLPSEMDDLAHYKGIRRLEWLACRWLLHKMTGAAQRIALGKDAFSKPFFLDAPDRHCSLSHSKGSVGALLAPVVCGCDVQVLVDKMPRLAPKFMREEEARFTEGHSIAEQFDLLHLHWTAKESLYKAYGLKALDFRAHLRVEAFMWNGKNGDTRAWIEKDAYRQSFQLHFAKYEPETGPPVVWTVCLQESAGIPGY
jgi:4'-phosphopantetheinyl transferase